MKTLKKNNKGFSLVELIVVILIMAIIAVALAPQVMKWVDKAKENADINNTAMLKSVADAAVADYMAEKNASAPTVTIKVKKGEAPSILAPDPATPEATAFLPVFVATLNCPDNQLPDPQNDGTTAYFQVAIAAGAVNVTIVTPASP